MYRRKKGIEVFLVHPGGPFFAHKNFGVWSIPKGEYGPDEEPLAAARREFLEETGFPCPEELISLGEVRQSERKIVTAWAFEGDCDPRQLRSNSFEMEWPFRSGQMTTFPEVDRGGWFSVNDAHRYLHPGQRAFLSRLSEKLNFP
jgi:predicted NUDIX family NTP pyrophosphohydrolase